MSIRESTEYAFAEALKSLLLTKDLQKIRVTELNYVVRSVLLFTIISVFKWN